MGGCGWKGATSKRPGTRVSPEITTTDRRAKRPLPIPYWSHTKSGKQQDCPIWKKYQKCTIPIRKKYHSSIQSTKKYVATWKKYQTSTFPTWKKYQKCTFSIRKNCFGDGGHFIFLHIDLPPKFCKCGAARTSGSLGPSGEGKGCWGVQPSLGWDWAVWVGGGWCVDSG